MPKDNANILFWADDISVERFTHHGKNGITVHHPDLIVLVILSRGGYVVLQQGHKAGTDREELTLPFTLAERIEEAPEEIATLLKKINVQSRKITLIHSLSAFPDKFSPLYHIYFVYDADVRGDVSKEFVLTPLQQYEGLITQGKLTDSVTIAALHLVKSKLYELIK